MQISLDHQQISMLLQLTISNLLVMAHPSVWVLLQYTWLRTSLNLQRTQEPLQSIQIRNSSKEQLAKAPIILQIESLAAARNHTVQFTTGCKVERAPEKAQRTAQPRISGAQWE
jgi:hypothetical protein